ncbi:Methyltransferase domain protein [Rosistilla oblonga]|uniref:class I SAM-dependent methyltransferase n=1 Tax=Rosistilla oblonga TaxID=2527990 RepID=UPI001187C8CD|nr:class I SAM-dependent methyltransferase [Rosistilla oblonga]QDV11308.1 Methyltransferase domain protein [Rosistilla oblonga]
MDIEKLKSNAAAVATLGNRDWLLSNGVYDCDSGSDYYWGEVPQDEMEQVIVAAESEGWEQAVRSRILPKYPHLENMIFGSSRVDWIERLPGSGLNILDVGSGWGQNSFLMAKNPANFVVSLEKIRARAAFQAVRIRQEGVGNMRVFSGGLEEFDMPDNSFDLVSFIGVLEWIGLADPTRSPRDVQVDALKKVRRMLKPGGTVCVGIENRVGFNNFLGAKDHSGLRFTSLMPRAVASKWVGLRTPAYRSNQSAASYRTYTYSREGYAQLFKDAGFSDCHVWVSHPHYGNPKCLINARNSEVSAFFRQVYRPSSIKDVCFTSAFRVLGRLGLAAKMAPHYVMFARG